MSVPGRLRLALDLLQLEGWRAMRDRLLDRLADRRLARSFRPRRHLGLPDGADLPSAAARVPTLRLISAPPERRMGGVHHHLISELERPEAGPFALLYPVDGGYEVRVAGPERRELWIWGPLSPPPPGAAEDPLFETVVLRTAHRLGARRLRVENPAGLPLTSLARLASRDLACELSIHDFSLFCHRPHLLERPVLHFCGYCRDLERCARCLASDLEISPGDQAGRRRDAGRLLRQAERVEYPSDFLRDRHRELFPDAGVDPERSHLVRPPSRFPADSLPQHRTARRPTVAVVGGLRPHKGSRVLYDLLRRLEPEERRRWRFVAFGAGDPAEERRARALGVRLRGYYRPGRLPSLLRRSGVRVALLLSIVPESYGLALDECMAAGVPVIAFDLGAVGERLRLQGTGTTTPLDAGATGILEALRVAMRATV